MPARIAQGRVGVSLPTEPQLAFQPAHARARDAVHMSLDVGQLLHDLADAGVAPPAPVLQLESAAPDRGCYLQRPDLGRRLSAASHDKLMALQAGAAPLALGYDLALVLAALLAVLATVGWRMAPLTIVQQARVAIGDEIGALIGAQAVVVLIGERPGLSAPDSMGLYRTWMPRPGLTNVSRNCISNVRPAGLDPVDTATVLQYLLVRAFDRQFSGVRFKDASRVPVPVAQTSAQFRLVPLALARSNAVDKSAT